MTMPSMRTAKNMQSMTKFTLIAFLLVLAACEKKVDRDSSYNVSGAWGGSDVKVPTLDENLRNEIQGMSYRILSEEEFRPIFQVLSAQITLSLHQSSDGAIHMNTPEPIGHAGRENDALVKEYRRRLYEAISSRLLSDYQNQAHP